MRKFRALAFFVRSQVQFPYLPLKTADLTNCRSLYTCFLASCGECLSRHFKCKHIKVVARPETGISKLNLYTVSGRSENHRNVRFKFFKEKVIIPKRI